MERRTKLVATCLLVAAACRQPVREAVAAGDYLEACRAYWADPRRSDVDPAVTAELDGWMREQVDLWAGVARVPLDSLRQGVEGGDRVAFKEAGSVLRVTVTAVRLPKGSRARVEPPTIHEGRDAHLLLPALADDGLVAKALEGALQEPPPLALEPIPPELLPREYVQEASGKLAYKDGVDPARVAMGVLTGGVGWLAQGAAPEPAWEPERDPKKLAALKKMSARKRKAYEKEQARKRAEFELARKKRADDRRAKDAQIEVIAARNREKVAERERELAARRAFAQRAAAKFAPSCPTTEEGALWLEPGHSCTYLTWGERKPDYLVAEAHGLGMDVTVQLSAQAQPCDWRMRAFLALPRTSDGPYLETVFEAFARAERKLGLTGAPR